MSRPSTEEVAAAWTARVATKHEAAGVDTSPLMQIGLLEELSKGQPVSRQRASELLGLPRQKIDDLFEAIDAAGGQLNDNGDFIGMALTLKPTRHRIRINGNDLYAWCSLDTILLPGVLETTGEIESTDTVTGGTIRLTVTADEVVEVDPPSAVTSVFVPGRNPTETGDDQPVVGPQSEVCSSMLFFTSREIAEQALENLPNIAILTAEEAFDLARQTWTEPTRALRKKAAAG
ncbi:MAG: organomercurial lyase [Acidimicrobiia bacterium]